MNNNEKKLDALIDALGFDVEESHVLDSDAYRRQCIAYSGSIHLMANKEDHIHPEFKFTKRDEPVEENKTITVSHALNMLCKRDRDIIDSFNNSDSVDNTPVGLGPMAVNSAAWVSIVRYILRHRMEIDLGSDDFDTLRPALSFFNGTSK
jgi:hypothetical protein